MPDNIPVIGPSRTTPNMVQAHGFELGLIGGCIVADLVTEGHTSLPIAAFAVDRFSRRTTSGPLHQKE